MQSEPEVPDKAAKNLATVNMGTELPLVEELRPCPDVATALKAFAHLPGLLLLDSALQRKHVGRYSFLTANPFRLFELPKAQYRANHFRAIRRVMRELDAAMIPELPPFQGGAAGLLSYELGGVWESLPTAPLDEFRLPAMAVGLYDWVIAWDHATHQAWVISQGFPETQIARRTDRAAKRLEWVKHTLSRAHLSSTSARCTYSRTTPPGQLAPQYPVTGIELPITSNYSRDAYLRAVERVIEYIFAGDIFQANLSQRLLCPAQQNPVDLYLHLRQCNPAPFAGYLSHADWALASASPERFVCVNGGEVETRPIKGTRQRRPGPEEDLFTRDELRESEKDQAENIMIVDLLRNDLSRVCKPGSIRVPHLCTVEAYETVQHLVSEIRGQLADGKDAWDLIEAVFPGGSITGAPKIRAMEIIAELEPTVRGAYCGSLFYIGFNGRMDSNILIRTFTHRYGWLQFPVGGGIIAQSNPSAEYEETLHKAAGLMRTLEVIGSR